MSAGCQDEGADRRPEADETLSSAETEKKEAGKKSKKREQAPASEAEQADPQEDDDSALNPDEEPAANESTDSEGEGDPSETPPEDSIPHEDPDVTDDVPNEEETPVGDPPEPPANGEVEDDTSDPAPTEEGDSPAIVKTALPGGDLLAGSDPQPIGEDEGDAPEPEEPPEEAPDPGLCLLGTGEPLPYDYTRGLIEEYAFELSMSCAVGGHLMPLMMEDPVELTAVFAFNSSLTEWYRAHVLGCDESASSWTSEQFGLLPVSEAGFSRGDVEGATNLFLMVLDRHDGAEDGMTAEQKQVLRSRLEAIGAAAVLVDSDEPTLPLDPAMCIPL